MISERALQWSTSIYPLSEGMRRCSLNPFDPATKKGCINMGTAENSLMFDFLKTKFSTTSELGNLSLNDLKYGSMNGSDRFKLAISTFLSKKLEIDINPSNIFTGNGCGTVVEALGNAIADPGEYFMVPAPYYGGFDMDLLKRPMVKILPVHSSRSNSYCVTLNDLIDAWETSIRQGLKVKALLAMNPVNPQGNIYSNELLMQMIEFCSERNIHLIMDEIYAFSVFNSTCFTSILKLSSKVHVLWGFSKDFCLNGFRCGVLISKNNELLAAMNEQSYFTCVSSVTQNILCNLLEDFEWNSLFIETNRIRLREAYDHVIQWIHKCNREFDKRIDFIPAEAGFFVFLDFSKFLTEVSKEKEYELWLDFIDNGPVYLALGEAFNCRDPGWFRLVFAMDLAILDLALDRVKRILQRRLH